jgi:hypothetical protein
MRCSPIGIGPTTCMKPRRPRGPTRR